MSDYRYGGGFSRPAPFDPPKIDVRERVSHAVQQELARIPSRTKAIFGLNDLDAVVDEVLAGVIESLFVVYD